MFDPSAWAKQCRTGENTMAASKVNSITSQTKTTIKLRNALPSTSFQDYAAVSLKVAMHINYAVNEMRSIEHDDSIKPVSRAKRRRYDDLSKVLAAYDFSDWGDVLTAGAPKSEAINKVFPA